jgi:hypothetical protein
MILKRRVALNGVQLDQVDSRIVISAVEPGDGKENISATDRASGFGQRVTSAYRSNTDIVVRFMILERGKSTTGMTNRSQVIEAVNAWAAGGGVLTTNYKTGRQINVRLVQAAAEGSLWDYSKEFALTFRAYEIPYWEDSTATSTTIGGESTTDDGMITVTGSGIAQADVTVSNESSSTVNSLTVTVGKTMTFSSLGLAEGESLIIDHVDGLVRIRIYNGTTYRSAMAKRTAGSADDFKMSPGSQAIGFSADQNCEMTVSWRNRYL